MLHMASASSNASHTPVYVLLEIIHSFYTPSSDHFLPSLKNQDPRIISPAIHPILLNRVDNI